MVAIILWRLIVTMVSRVMMGLAVIALLFAGAMMLNGYGRAMRADGYTKGWEDAVKTCRAAPIDLNFACAEGVTHET